MDVIHGQQKMPRRGTVRQLGFISLRMALMRPADFCHSWHEFGYVNCHSVPYSQTCPFRHPQTHRLFSSLENEMQNGSSILPLVVINGQRYGTSMIKSFRDRDTERLFKRERIRKLPTRLHRIGLRKLLILDAADTLTDLKLPPGNRLEKLKGDRAGQHSIRINEQWRVCFRWRDGDACDVEITDYH